MEKLDRRGPMGHGPFLRGPRSRSGGAMAAAAISYALSGELAAAAALPALGEAAGASPAAALMGEGGCRLPLGRTARTHARTPSASCPVRNLRKPA